MADYRLYFLGDDGKIRSAKEIECAEDLDAIDKATSLLDGLDIEIWQGARKVALVKTTERKRT